MLILLVVYIPIYVWVWRRPEQAERYHLVKYGPAIMIKTRLGIGLMDRLARYTRFWRFFGFLSKFISAALMALMVYVVIVGIINLPSRMGGSSIGIEYALAIPGFNPILPLSYGIVALFVAMVVHEMGHGIQARANNVDVNSTGLLYAVVPLGAFVEPDEEGMSKSSRRVQMDVYTAGISVNTICAVLCIFILMFSMGSVSSPYDDSPAVTSVDADSPAFDSGLPISAIITGISEDGVLVYPAEAVWSKGVVSLGSSATEVDPSKKYYIEYVHDGQTRMSDVPIHLGVYVKSVVSGGPANEGGIGHSVFIYSITNVTQGGDEEVFSTTSEFTGYMSGTRAGDEVLIRTMDKSGSFQEHTLVLGGNGGIGYLGVYVDSAGFALTTPERMLSIASNPFAAADGSPMSYVTSFLSYLSGPMNGMAPVDDDVQWWYDVPMGDLFWILMSLAYWLFWLNILLAISNMLPAYPFDGGFVFRGGIDWLLEKFGVRDAERREELTSNATNVVSNVMIFMFLLIVIGFLI